MTHQLVVVYAPERSHTLYRAVNVPTADVCLARYFSARWGGDRTEPQPFSADVLLNLERQGFLPCRLPLPPPGPDHFDHLDMLRLYDSAPAGQMFWESFCIPGFAATVGVGSKIPRRKPGEEYGPPKCRILSPRYRNDGKPALLICQREAGHLGLCWSGHDAWDSAGWHSIPVVSVAARPAPFVMGAPPCPRCGHPAWNHTEERFQLLGSACHLCGCTVRPMGGGDSGRTAIGADKAKAAASDGSDKSCYQDTPLAPVAFFGLKLLARVVWVLPLCAWNLIVRPRETLGVIRIAVGVWRNCGQEFERRADAALAELKRREKGKDGGE